MYSTSEGGVISSITNCAKQKHTIIIIYKDRAGNVSSRETEPYEIKDGAYYGYDIDGGSIKRFMLTNILGTEKTNTEYEPRWSVKF